MTWPHRPNHRPSPSRGRRGSVRRLLLPVMAGVLMLVSSPAPGQGQVDPNLLRRIQRQTEELDSTLRLRVTPGQPIGERLMLDYGGSLRFGFFAIDDDFGSTRILRQTDSIFYVRGELDGAHSFFARARFLYNDFNSGDSFDGRGDRLIAPIVDRYWYQFDLRDARLAETGENIPYNVRVRGGRQWITWGAGITLANALYSGLIDVELDKFGFEGLVGLTPATGTIDFDGSRPSFDTNTQRAFFGARLEYRALAKHRPYVAALIQRDKNDDNFALIQTPLTDFPTRFKYDSEYWSIGSRGVFGSQLTYQAEFVYETGEGRSSSFDDRTGAAVPQTKEDVEAWAGSLTLTYLHRDAAKTRLDFQFAAGSGDSDRLDSADTFGGNRAGTDDQSFNAFGYVNTGLALAPELANLLMLRAGASTSFLSGIRRDDWLRVGVAGFLFGKTNRSAPISVPTTDDRFIGGEVDFFLDWRVTSDISANVRYGVFIPGDAMPKGQNDPRHFFYAGVTYAF